MNLPGPLPSKSPQVILGAVLLLAAGIGGGRVLGYVVEPEECSQARVELAACAARDELVRESLEEAREAVEDLQARLHRCEVNP